MEIVVRFPRVADEGPCTELASLPLGARRARTFIRSHLREHRLVVAEAAGEVVGLLAWRTDWFQCSLVSLVLVREDFRRRGIARELYRAVEARSPGPRLFSSTRESDAAGIRVHAALGFRPSGFVDNLPQGERELLFYRRIPPRPGVAPGAEPGGNGEVPDNGSGRPRAEDR